MTARVEMALGEIARVAAWSLRALGMTFGVADRAAPIVAWTEAVEGGALSTLRKLVDQVAARPAEPWHSKWSPGAWSMDATGRSVLEIGPVAMDILTLPVRTGQVGRVDITNAIDTRFLSGVFRIAVRRQVGIVALSPGSDLVLCGESTATLHAAPGRHGAIFSSGDLPRGEPIARALADWQNAPHAADAGTLSLFSYAPTEPFDDGERRCHAECKFAEAQAQGVLVDCDDMDQLYRLEIKTWAPTSERSRKQALA